jgi:hypothetical protein
MSSRTVLNPSMAYISMMSLISGRGQRCVNDEKDNDGSDIRGRDDDFLVPPITLLLVVILLL